MPTLAQKIDAANQRTIHAAGPRYSPALDPDAPNLEIAELIEAVSSLVFGERARARAQEHSAAIRRAVKDSDTTLTRLLGGVQTTPSTVAEDLDRLARTTTSPGVRRAVLTLRRHVRIALRTVERRQERIESRRSRLRDSTTDQLSDSERREREILQYQARDLRNVWSALREANEWAAGVEGQLLADRQCALLLGPWGSGKTHFACDFTLAATHDGVPALVVLASSLRDDLEPLDAVSAATGIGRSGTDLATKLDRAAKRAGRRALITIDAINEADREAWRRRLPEFLRALASYEHLGVILTCRSPFERAILTRATSAKLVVLFHRGFQDQEFDAQQEFFAHYGLPAPHVPLITPEFSRPLFLRLLCEAFARLSRTSQHRQLRDIASGQKGMTYVLEYFAKAVGLRVEDTHSLPALTCWKLMKGQLGKGYQGFAGRMADQHLDYLKPAEVVDEIVGQTGATPAAATAIAQDMVSEGLLAEDMRYVGGVYETVLTLPYQRFADHLVARHLLDKHLDTSSETSLRRSFYANRPLGAVFSFEGWSRQYAEPGLASAIMLEFPERVKRLGLTSELIFYLPQARRLVEPFVRTFLDGLYWRGGTAFTADTSRVIDRLLGFDVGWITAETYETLMGLATRPAHPLNAASLWQRLSSQDMPTRDLAWSEALRGSDVNSNLRRLLAWTERRARPPADEAITGNEMRVLALGLTTTDRVMRDRCTRALVRLGEGAPGPLFALTLEALSFNDPYVGERLLAASYGVCMRRWALESASSSFADSAVELARKLVEEMLRPSGKHFTWHALARGYAIGIVQLARRLRPRALPATVLDHLVPDPTSAPSPFRPVNRIRPRDVTDGDHAIHMDFGNYTMGRLITDRQNYDMKHVEYRRVRRQIEDRIRRLGYSKERFGEIDRGIGRTNWREDRGRKTDRYGKKYSWIAYFEMYGLREALGLLEDRWSGHERTSDCDVDPTFPSDTPGWMAPVQDIFDSSPLDQIEWLERGGTPDHRPLLDRDEVDGVAGDWVLLDATIRDHGSNGREVVSHVASVMASATNVGRLRAEFARGHSFGDQGIPEGGADYYTYLGEVPWSRHFGSDARTATGRPKKSTQRAFDYFDRGRWRPGIPVEATARRWVWESYHSDLNQTDAVEFPAPPLADFLKLRGASGSADLVDSTLRTATIFRRSPDDDGSSHYLYIRRDLLDGYLKVRKLRLVRALWGERTLHYDFFKDDLPDAKRQPFIDRSNTFRFVDCHGEWIELGQQATD